VGGGVTVTVAVALAVSGGVIVVVRVPERDAVGLAVSGLE
jgi:hypothetical protein